MEVENKYHNLIIKYLDNSIADEEWRDLTNWLKEDDSHLKFFADMRDLWAGASLVHQSGEETEQALSEFHQSMTQASGLPERKIKIVRFMLQAAATIGLALLISFGYQKYFAGNKNNPQIGQAYSEVVVPIGHKAQMTLPDGTKVWLNSNSSLRYPVNFSGDYRKVKLTGEAYIDVIKDKKHPFIVETEEISLYVTGTSFNVKAYGDERQIETTLINGSLKIFPSKASQRKFRVVTLKPNEKAIYLKKESSISVNELDAEPLKERKNKKNDAIKTTGLEISQVEAIISWKDNELIFRNETLEEMCIKMERWYGISINIQDALLKNYRYSGKFIYNETVNQVMDILALTTPIKYTFDKNVLTIFEGN